MHKVDELKDKNSCLNRADPSEMLFVLLARDAVAADAIRFWCHERVRRGKNRYSDEQIVEAFQCADMMDLERLAPKRNPDSGAGEKE